MRKLELSQLIGMNCHYAHQTFEYYLDSLLQNGIERLEIWGASPHFYVNDMTPAILKERKDAVKSRGMKIMCLTPETVVYPVNIAAKEDYLRRRSVDEAKKGIDYAAELECNKMLITPGWGYISEPREEALKRSLDSLAEIAKHAEKAGVMLGFEHLSPISSNLINNSKDVKMVLDTIASPNMKALVDTCQVALSHEHIRDYFELLGKDIIHIHLVDGTPGGHLAFGDGNLPLEDFVKTAAEFDYEGCFSMEIADRKYFEHPEAADKQSKDAFAKWIGA